MKKLAAIALLATPVMAADAPLVDGLWIQHDAWRYAPKEINEDGDVHKNADAAVMNFCADGSFRLATGVIYQSKRSPVVMTGASDGLAIYRGTRTRNAGEPRKPELPLPRPRTGGDRG